MKALTSKTILSDLKAILTSKGTVSFRNDEKPWQTCHLLWLLEQIEQESTDFTYCCTMGFVIGCMTCNGWIKPTSPILQYMCEDITV